MVWQDNPSLLNMFWIRIWYWAIREDGLVFFFFFFHLHNVLYPSADLIGQKVVYNTACPDPVL